MDKIVFIDDGHKYLYKDNSLLSGTTFIKKYSPPFDSEKMSTISAVKKIIGEDLYKRLRKEIFAFNFKPDIEDVLDIFMPICGGEDNFAEVKKSILEEWDDSGPKGTAFHKDRENEFIEAGSVINPFTGNSLPLITFDKYFDNEVYSMDLMDCPDGFYTEFLVFHKGIDHNRTICGTIDMLWIESEGKKRFTYTDDWKTNSSEPSDSKFEKMLPPVQDLFSNKHNDYILQGSLYQTMLMSHGFTPKQSAYTWVKDYDKDQLTRKPFEFMFDKIESLLEDYNNVNVC